MKIFYFTTTGNSLAVARAIGGELLSIVSVLSGCETGFADDGAIGVVCPVYFGELPAPVAEFLERVKLSAPYRFLVLTCGNTPAFAVKAPGEWGYVRSIRMVDNYFPMFDVSKQVRDLPRKRVGERLAEIVADIHGISAPEGISWRRRLCMGVWPDGGCACSRFLRWPTGDSTSTRRSATGVARADGCARSAISPWPA